MHPFLFQRDVSDVRRRLGDFLVAREAAPPSVLNNKVRAVFAQPRKRWLAALVGGTSCGSRSGSFASRLSSPCATP